MGIFKDGGPLDPRGDKKVFIQRKEFSDILLYLHHGHKYVSIASPRSTGKTTLLYQLCNALKSEDYGLIYVDLSPCSQLGEAKFYLRLTNEIQEEISSQVVFNTDVPYDIKSVTDHFACREYLRWICGIGDKARRIIIMLDEIGGVPDECCPSFFDQLRWIFTQSKRAQHTILGKLVFILAGALDLAKLHEDRNSPLRNVCEEFPLEDFTVQDVSRLVKNLARLSPEERNIVAGQIFNWTDGHPFLTQRACALIEKNAGYKKGKIAEPAKLVDALVEDDLLNGEIKSYLKNHVFKHLKDAKIYEDVTFEIFNGKKRKSHGTVGFLDVIGIVKRGNDQYFRIRNRIIEKALGDYFGEEPR
jgi:hypothetical protein